MHDTIQPDQLYRLLVEQVTDYGIFGLDVEGHVLTWNPGAERLKGYTADEIIGRHFSVFYTSEDAAAGVPQEMLDQAKRTGHAEAEGWRVRKDGSRFWASVTITALRDDAGRVIAFAKIVRDLTQRRENEDRARRLAAEEAAHAATNARRRELETLNFQLQEQATELETQTEEAQSLAEETEQANEALQHALDDAEVARQAAATSDEFSRTILESIGDPFIVLDADSRVRFANDAAKGLLGTAFEEHVRRALGTGARNTFEFFNSDRGKWFAVQRYGLPHDGVAVQARDVTAIKHAEEASRYLVRASEILGGSLDYRRTLDELARLVVPELADWCAVEVARSDGVLEQCAVAHVDPEKVRWARELSRRYPGRRDAPTGAYNVLRTGQPELYPEISDEMLVAGAIDDEHLRITRALGIRSALVVPLVAHGPPIGVLTLISSESARKYTPADQSLAMELAHRAAMAVENARLHQDAVASRQQAEHANHAKTQFLATMSHELRTPLNAILGYTDLLEAGIRGPVSPDQKDYLERIARSGRYLLSLIQDVLSFAKIETGRVELNIVPVAMQPLLDEMEKLILPQARAAGLEVAPTGCGDDIVARGDPERIRQILLNLLTNAVKFTPSPGRISVSCSVDDSTARVVVRDTGPGIPEEKVDEIFAPFVQLRRESAGSQAGTGLGLAISRDLARAMHGDLIVEREVRDGSAFTLSLPRAEHAAQ